MPLLLGGERPKSSEIFWPGEKEARRLVVAVGVGGGEFSLFAIWQDVGVEVLTKGRDRCHRKKYLDDFFVCLM